MNNCTDASAFKFLKIRHSGWSQARSPPPALLVDAGVPGDLWHRTYDGTIQHQESMTRQNWYWWQQPQNAKYRLALLFSCLASFGVAMDWPPGFFLSILVLLFTMCWEVSLRNEQKASLAEWAAFVQQQEELYLNYGVRMKMMKIKDGRVPATILVGALLFEKMDNPPGGSRDGSAATNTLIRDLESLHGLHRSGALTDEEYSKAKGAVLASADRGSIDTAQFSAESGGIHQVVRAEAVAVAADAFSPIHEPSPENVHVGERTKLIEGGHVQVV